ncbi:MAG: DUF4062 domain-containing protein, partial [Myxococcales bacterium]|nr:DUF4062 domain-containing protein [Myxococcales bacterium]
MASQSEEDEPAIRVFVSSTFIDNEARRKVVEDAILRARMVPVGMERFAANTLPKVEATMAVLDDCDWLVGLVAYRYGWIPPEQPPGQERSITEIEYDAAGTRGMPRLMFVIDDSVAVNPMQDFDEGPDRWRKQERLDAFKQKIGEAPAKFRDETLGVQVFQALIDERNRQAAERAKSSARRGPVTVPTTMASADAGEVPEHELQRYLGTAESLHHKIQLLGFEKSVRIKIGLDDLYVPLDAMIDRGRKGREVYDSAQHAELAKCGEHGDPSHSEIPLAEAFTRARAMNRRGLILLGDPGAGKTTHLEQVLLKVIRDGPETLGLPEDTVPVFLPLRNLRDLDEGLPGFIQQELQNPMLNVAEDFGKRLCQRGRLLYLLDGLDEVANATERAKVARWIEEALAYGANSYFLVSCRYAGYTADVELAADFLELHLRPLSKDQMTAFVTHWYAIVERE